MSQAAKYAIGAILVVLVLARAPFLRGQLCDEEGAIATAVRHMVHGERPRFTLARTADGHEVLILPEHNLGGFLLPALLFAAPYYGLHADRSVNHRIVSVYWLRGVYLLIYAAALILALLILPPERRLLGATLLAAFSLFPLPLLASVQIQYDGAVSTFLLVASSLLLARGSERGRALVIAAGGFVLALGKLEYLCVGVGTALLAAIVLKSPRVALAYVIGALVGSALCAAIDWTNFVASYHVIGKFSGYQQGTGLTPWMRIRVFLGQFIPELWPLFAALALALISAPLLWRERRAVVFTLVPGAAVIVAYVLFAWRGDGFPRYFAPAFVLLPIALAQLWKPAWWSFAVAGALSIAALVASRPELLLGSHALARHVGVTYDSVALARGFDRITPGCLRISSWETGYYTVRASYACWAIDAYQPALRSLVCR